MKLLRLRDASDSVIPSAFRSGGPLSAVSRAERRRRMRLIAVRCPDLTFLERVNRAAVHSELSRHAFILRAVEAAVARVLRHAHGGPK